MNLSLITAIATTTALAACHHDTAASPTADTTVTPGVTPGEPAATGSPARDALADGRVSRTEHDLVQRSASESLQKLQALSIVRVGQLIVDAPAGTGNCYGPCEGDPTSDAWMIEHARQAVRLEELLTVATKVHDAAKPGDSVTNNELALIALRGLKIIEIDGVYYDSSRCYSVGCPESLAATVALADALAKKK